CGPGVSEHQVGAFTSCRIALWRPVVQSVACCYPLPTEDHRDLHSFPTRRSSDLGFGVGGNREIQLRQPLEVLIVAPEQLSGLPRSEEHTSELQSRFVLVCRPLLETKKLLQSQSLFSYHLFSSSHSP